MTKWDWTLLSKRWLNERFTIRSLGRHDLSPSKIKIWTDCTQKFKYRYVDKIRGPTGGAALQGSSLHEVFLEEFLVGGIDDTDALVEMMAMDLQHRLDTQDPRDYKTGLPLTEGEKAEFTATSHLG